MAKLMEKPSFFLLQERRHAMKSMNIGVKRLAWGCDAKWRNSYSSKYVCGKIDSKEPSFRFEKLAKKKASFQH